MPTMPTEKEIASNLVYAADINFENSRNLDAAKQKAEKCLREIIENLFETGITIKVNTLERFLGIEAIELLLDAGFSIFTDLKLFDVLSTIENELSWLQHVPNLKVLTIAENVNRKIFERATDLLPNTIIAPVYPLTDLNDLYFMERGEGSREEVVRKFFKRVDELPTAGVICSPKDLQFAPSGFLDNHTLITPAIRPSWYSDKNDTNSVNALTPTEAINNGANMIVVGSPIRYQDDMLGNVQAILDEMTDAYIKRLVF